MTNAILRGKPDAGNPHVRFDEGEVASAKPRRGSLLYNRRLAMLAAVAASAVGAAPLLGVAGSCIISGETNRVESTVVEKPMTGSLDSFWRDFGFMLFNDRFRAKRKGGSVIILR